MNLMGVSIFVLYLIINKNDLKKNDKIIEKKFVSHTSKLDLTNPNLSLSIEKHELPELKIKPKPIKIIKPIELISEKRDEVKKTNFSIVPIKVDNNVIALKKGNFEFNKLKSYSSLEKNKIEVKSKHSVKLDPIKTKKTMIPDNKTELTQNLDEQNDLIEDGKAILKEISQYHVEFLWPVDIRVHDKIYKILNECLFTQTVLMNSKNEIYGINGLIHRDNFVSEFSSIIRMPNNVYSNVENEIIKKIRIKYLDKEMGRHLRIFNKNIDAYIMGYYLDLAKKNGIKLKKIKGSYKVINDKLYLENLVINDKQISDKILLSSIKERCYV